MAGPKTIEKEHEKKDFEGADYYNLTGMIDRYQWIVDRLEREFPKALFTIVFCDFYRVWAIEMDNAKSGEDHWKTALLVYNRGTRVDLVKNEKNEKAIDEMVENIRDKMK